MQSGYGSSTFWRARILALPFVLLDADAPLVHDVPAHAERWPVIGRDAAPAPQLHAVGAYHNVGEADAPLGRVLALGLALARA